MNNRVSADGGAMPSALPRRGFLRGLAALPLIGGGISIIGAPTATAEPVTRKLLSNYASWLHMEHRALCHEAGLDHRFIDCNAGFHHSIFNAHGELQAPASTRAALVLSAVGCEWREGADV